MSYWILVLGISVGFVCGSAFTYKKVGAEIKSMKKDFEAKWRWQSDQHRLNLAQATATDKEVQFEPTVNEVRKPRDLHDVCPAEASRMFSPYNS